MPPGAALIASITCAIPTSLPPRTRTRLRSRAASAVKIATARKSKTLFSCSRRNVVRAPVASYTKYQKSTRPGSITFLPRWSLHYISSSRCSRPPLQFAVRIMLAHNFLVWMPDFPWEVGATAILRWSVNRIVDNERTLFSK